jgi:hypothetical protein
MMGSLRGICDRSRVDDADDQHHPNNAAFGSSTFEREKTDMSTPSAAQHGHHSKFGPAIVATDEVTERGKLIAANQAFAVALKQALLSGGETSAGVLATVRPKRGKNGSLAL